MKRSSVAKCLSIILLTVLIFPGILQTNQLAVANNNQTANTYETASFTPKTILFDESHCGNGSSLWAPGNASLFSWMLGVNGYSSDTNFNESLDSGILNNYDILVIFFPESPLSGSEISAVLSFVNDGGGLLLVGVDNHQLWNFKVSHLNPISSTFGITFQSDDIDESITTFAANNITYGVTSMNTRGDDLEFCSLAVTPPATTVVTSSGGPIVATSEYGLGRAVCVGGPSPFYMYRKNAAGFGDSDFQFSLNVIDWLSGNPERTADVPQWATITCGAGPSLTQNELDQYSSFVGIYHEHTTHSPDGTSTPQEMLEKGLELGLDFMVMSDHVYDRPASIGGITGGVAMNNLATTYHLDEQVIIGAELSSVKRTVGFPLTQNIFTGDQQTAVNEIHAQGGIAVLAHPTIGFDYAPVYVNFTQYGYDAVEVDNRGFFFGGGEDGYRYNFLGGADTHTQFETGTLVNVIFVQNPSGPNGRVTGADIVDAVLHRRVVIVDQYNDFIYGQAVWVNYYKSLMDQAETAINSAETMLNGLVSGGANISLSELYLQDAQTAWDNWNPGRALRMVENATSDVLLGLDFDLSTPTYLEPNTGYQAAVTLKNNHTYGIAINTSTIARTGVTFNPADNLVEAAGKSTSTTYCDYSSIDYGLAIYSMNLYSFNTSDYINPILIYVRGIVDNVSAVVSQNQGSYSVDFTYWMGRASSKYITSATLVYDDGSGEQSAALERGWDNFLLTLGPFDPGTQLVVRVVVKTNLGYTFTIGENTLQLGTATTTTTTTSTTTSTNTTTTTHSGVPLNANLLIIVAGAGIGIVVLALVIVKIRK